MKRPTLIGIGGVVLIGAVLYALGRWDAAVSSREAAAVAAAQAWLEAGKARRAERARLLAAAQHAGAQAAALATAARAHAAADVARDQELARARTAADSVPILLEQRDSARAAVATWAQAFAALTLKDRADSLQADAAEAAADSAAARIRAVLPIADCHWLGVGFLPRCPSRTVNFLVGGALVELANLLTRR